MKLRRTEETKKEDLTELVDLITEDEPKSEVVEINKKEGKRLEKESKKKEPRESIVDKLKNKLKKKDNKVEKTEEENGMKKRKKRKFKLDLSVIIFFIIILLVGALVFYLTVGQRGSKYGDRLRGIENISFTKKDKNKYVESLTSNENVKSASIDIQGRIIYVIVDFKDYVSLDDARNIVNDSLANLSDEVKGFYDINALITKSDEQANEEGKKEFPRSGYKRKTSGIIVW